MTCQDARELFSAFVDEALGADERGPLDAHLSGCAECRRELERFRQTMVVLHAVRPVRAPAGFVDRVLEAARPTSWHWRLAKRLFWPLQIKLPLEAAAVALVAVAAVYVFQHTPELQRAARQEAPPPAVSDSARAPAAPAERRAEPATDPRKESASVAGPKAESDTLANREAEKPATPPASRNLEPAPATPSVEKKARPAAPLPEESKSKGSGPAAVAPASPPAAQAKSAPALEGRLDASRDRQKPGSSQPRQELAARAPAQAASDVSGRLTVGDREAAMRALTELLARVGASEISRRSEGATTVIEIGLARDAYAELARGLSRIGQWTAEREPAEFPARLSVTVRLTE